MNYVIKGLRLFIDINIKGNVRKAIPRHPGLGPVLKCSKLGRNPSLHNQETVQSVLKGCFITMNYNTK